MVLLLLQRAGLAMQNLNGRSAASLTSPATHKCVAIGQTIVVAGMNQGLILSLSLYFF